MIPVNPLEIRYVKKSGKLRARCQLSSWGQSRISRLATIEHCNFPKHFTLSDFKQFLWHDSLGDPMLEALSAAEEQTLEAGTIHFLCMYLYKPICQCLFLLLCMWSPHHSMEGEPLAKLADCRSKLLARTASWFCARRRILQGARQGWQGKGQLCRCWHGNYDSLRYYWRFSDWCSQER